MGSVKSTHRESRRASQAKRHNQRLFQQLDAEVVDMKVRMMVEIMGESDKLIAEILYSTGDREPHGICAEFGVPIKVLSENSSWLDKMWDEWIHTLFPTDDESIRRMVLCGDGQKTEVVD